MSEPNPGLALGEAPPVSIPTTASAVPTHSAVSISSAATGTAGSGSGTSGATRTGAPSPAHGSASPLSLFSARFLSHRVAAGSLVFLCLLGVLALCAPWIAASLRVSPTDQNIEHRFAPPGASIALPAAQTERRIEEWVAGNPTESGALTALALARGWAPGSLAAEDVPFELPSLLQGNREAGEALAAEAPGYAALLASFHSRHPLGTDELGRDVFSRLLHGARVSLLVALLVGLCAGGIGLMVGAVAGYFGGAVDAALMRVTDALLTLPTLPLYIILAAIDLSKLPGLGSVLRGETQSMFKLVVIMGAFTWMGIARVVRGAVLPLRDSEFVVAARSLGGGHARILLRHVVPNVVGPLLVAVTLLMGEAMLVESGLSFLGLGIQPPQPSWGNMLQNGLELVRDEPLLAILPGALIFAVIISVNFVGDGLRDAFDPRATRR